MKQKLITRFACAASLCLTLLTAGCSSFNSEWRQAASRKPSRDLSGRWQGRWISTKDGHSGELRAVITPVVVPPGAFLSSHRFPPPDTNRFHALFHATYAAVLNFTYPVNFDARQHGTRIDFSGAAELPSWAGGRYASTGHATRTDFTATYKSKYDEGRFEMKRVEPNPAPVH